MRQCHSGLTDASSIMMSIRQEFLSLIEQLSDEQLALLLPLAAAVQGKQYEEFSSTTSPVYQEWVGAENDIYDDLFADELATR